MMGLLAFFSGMYFIYEWFGWWGYLGVFFISWVITLLIPKNFY